MGMFWGLQLLLILDGNVQLSTSATSWRYQGNRASVSATIFLADMSAVALEDPMATPSSPVAAPPQVMATRYS